MAQHNDDLFELGRQSLRALTNELAIYALYVDAKLEVRPGRALLCHFSREDGLIYLSIPDPETERGKFELLLLRAMIRFDSNEELMRLLELLIPWLIAHETGHYLRHKDGLFRADLWDEERVANQLAIAFTKQRLSQDEREVLLQKMTRAIAGLALVVESKREPVAIRSRRNLVHYIYTHMCWFYADLLAEETLTIAEFAQAHQQQCARLCL